MKKYLLVLVAALTLLGQGVQQSEAKVTVKERTIYYSVSGRTGKEIYQQILRKGPTLKGKKGTHVASTTLTVRTRDIKGFAKGNRCKIADVNVTVDVVFRIPKWSGGGSPQVRRAWDNFIAHIWRHEQRHREIGLDYAKRLESGIKGFSGDLNKNCEGLDGQAKWLSERERNWFYRKQQAFDASWFGDGGRQFKHDKALIAAK